MIDTTNINTALAGALVDELARGGCRQAVISPGSRSSPTALALARHPEIEHTVVVDERVAGFVALGLALASRSPAAVTCTSGSAAANLHPAVAEADQAGVPMVILTNDRPPELRGIGAGQTIDQVKLYGSAVRWFAEAGAESADDAGLLHYRTLGCRAAAEAAAGRGPVQLNLPWRDPLGVEPVPGAVSASGSLALEGRRRGAPLTAVRRGRKPDEVLLDSLASRLAAAERPLIIAGRHGVRELPGAIAALSEGIDAPVLADPTSGLRRRDGDGSPIVIASYDLLLGDPAEPLRPDLVLRFGDMPTSKPLRAWLADPAIEQLVIDPPGGWNDPSRIAAELVSCDPRALADGLVGRVAARASPSTDRSTPPEGATSPRTFAERWQRAERIAQAALDDGLGSALSEPAAHRRIWTAIPAGSAVLVASSMPIRDAEAYAPVGEGALDVFANRGANGIDGLVATATGIARNAPGPTFAILGDLATVHDLGGVANLARQRLDLRLVVLQNQGGRIFEHVSQASELGGEELGELFLTPAELELERVATLAELRYELVDSLDRLTPALARPGPSLVEIMVDPPSGVGLRRRIAERVREALAALGVGS